MNFNFLTCWFCLCHIYSTVAGTTLSCQGCFQGTGSLQFCHRLKYPVLFENCNYIGLENCINLPTLKSLFDIQSTTLPIMSCVKSALGHAACSGGELSMSHLAYPLDSLSRRVSSQGCQRSAVVSRYLIISLEKRLGYAVWLRLQFVPWFSQ